MLPEIIWSQPRLGTFNLHASLLPQYRGAAPINWAIINGETRTGVTTFFLNSEIDKGDIIDRREVAIAPNDTAGTLHDRLMAVGAELVIATVENIAAGPPRLIKQRTIENFPFNAGIDNAPRILKPAPKIFKDDCRIDWRRTPEELYNFVRGLSPYPSAWTIMKKADGEEVTVKVFAVQAEIAATDKALGEVITDGKTFLKVACNGGYISILDLQAAGKKRMKTDEFMRGASPHGFL